MANVIKPKRSNTGGAVPTTGNLSSGEIAVNMADKKVYINNGTAVVQVGAGDISGLSDVTITTPSNGQVLSYNSGTSKWVNSSAGTGDVVGPASATDNALARFDGATGKLIQNSTVTLADNGNIAAVNGLSFNTTPTSPPTATGSVFWDSGDGTPSVVLNANTNLQLGQESIALVYNGTGSTINKGQVVAVSGAQGQRPSVVLADADTEALSAPTLGIAAESIANGAEGFICTFGLVRGLNTSAFTAGAPIYLSGTAGAFTATKPVAPQHIVALGWVISVNASSGEVFVNINNGWELDELHNVAITSAASGNTLIYDAVAGVWENANLTAGTGISVTNGAGSITIANTGVTSVTGTSPVASSGGATPAISLASGYGDTQNPYANKTANFFLAAPNGTAGAPTFRAIVAADVPTLNQNTTGTASNVTGTVAIANGGSGQTTAQTAMNAFAGAVTSGSYLRGNGTNVVMSTIQAGDVPTLNQNTTGSAATLTTARTIQTNLASTSSASFNGSANITPGVTGTLPLGNGGTGQTTAPAANAALSGFTTTATAAGTTTLTDTSSYYQVFTGTQAQTVQLPATSRLAQGWSFHIVNNSTGTLTLQTSTAVSLGTIPSGVTVMATALTITGNTAADWEFGYTDFSTITGTGANVLATSPTLVTPLLGTPTSGTLTNCTGLPIVGGTTGTLTVARGGTNLTTIAARSIPVANTADTYTTVTPAAGQSIRVNAGNTAWEAYTPGTGTVTSVGGTGTVSGLTLTGTVTTSGNLTLGGNLSITADMIYDSFTATASQTIFTTSVTYTSGKIDVYANGIRMVNGADVTVTSGTQVVFATGLTVGTRVDLVYPT